MDKQTATCLQYMLVTCQREGKLICAAACMFVTVWRMIYDSHDSCLMTEHVGKESPYMLQHGCSVQCEEWSMIAMIPIQMGEHLASKESKQHAADSRTSRQQTSSSQSLPHPPEKTEGVQVWTKDIKLVLTTSCRICWGSSSHAGVLDGESWAGQSGPSWMDESHGVSCQWLLSVSSQEHVFTVKMCYCSEPVRRQGPLEDTMR